MTPESSVLQKAAITADLMESGIALMRQNLRRRNPGASERAIDEMLRAWLHRRDDAIPGDVAGPVRIRSLSA